MVYPVNADKSEGDEIEAQCGENGTKAGEAVLVGNLELEHHDGNDDGDDSVGEGFEASWGGGVMGRDVFCRAGFWAWQKHTTAIVRAWVRRCTRITVWQLLRNNQGQG